MKCGSCGAENPAGKRFCGDCGAPLVVPAHAPNDPMRGGDGLRPVRLPSVERRSLTIMFADLVGSTELSTRVDPEDFRDVIAACHNVVSDCARRYGGFVARYVGDAAMVLFGYPEPREQEAERAVRAALAATDAFADMRLLNGSFQPRLRIGIATGLAVVGDLMGSGTDVAGETPNFASRLHSLARPGEVIVSAATRRLLGHQFEVRRRGDVMLKGFAEPVGVFRVVGTSRTDGRSWFGSTQPLGPMLGREADRATLHALWDKARQGKGQVVLLTGEPGIGKSRLLAALQDDVAECRHVRLRYFCSPYHTSSALQPVVAQLERAARFTREDSIEQRLGKLGDLLDPPPRQRETIDAIADLLALRASTAGSPQERKDRTLNSLVGQLRTLTERDPVLLVGEDSHWADPTSRELMEMVVDAAANTRILAIFAARPEFQPGWTDKEHVTTLTLSRFEQADSMALIRGIAQGKSLPPRVAADIIARSDGVPLFIEEMTKAVLESDRLVERDTHYELVGRAVSIDIPETLSASLLARLGPPSVMRELALIGATIGREFSHELLAVVSEHPEPILREALARLIETGLVFMRNRQPNAVYVFKHALVRDAAYAMLLRDRRRSLHASIAEALRTRHPDTAERQPELLAQHYQAAGLHEPALAAWGAAAKRASERWAMAEAVDHYEKALEVLAHLPASGRQLRHEVAVVTALGNALIASRGYTAPRTGEVYDRARVLCEQLGNTANLIRVANGQWSFHLMRSEIAQATSVAEDLHRRFARQPAPELGLAAHRLLGISMLQTGRLAVAREHLEAAAAQLRDGSPDMPGARDATVAIPAYLSVVLAMQGNYEEAYAQRALALQHARQSSNPHRLAFALGVAAVWFNVVMDDGTAELDGFTTLTEERDFPFWRGFAVAHRGIAMARAGNVVEGLALVREGEAIHRAMGTYWGIPQSLGSVSRFLPSAEGLPIANDALRDLDATGVRWFAPELQRIKGDLLRSGNATDAAEQIYLDALDEANRHGSRHWAMRIALSLATLWWEQGRDTAIPPLLAPLVAALEGPRAPVEVRLGREMLDKCARRMQSS
jgi:class 3 adenylate cyclase/tetratricopeptide (TPR) repeat protein